MPLLSIAHSWLRPSTTSSPVTIIAVVVLGSGAGGHITVQLPSYLPVSRPLETHAPERVGSHAVPPAYGGRAVAGGMPGSAHCPSGAQGAWLRCRRAGMLRVMPTRWSGVWAARAAAKAGRTNTSREGFMTSLRTDRGS